MGMEQDWQLPKLAVTFANPGQRPMTGEPLAPGPYPNMFGRTRTTCRLCGECDIGCNFGSKNTLDHTYLSAAKHLGAELRTRCEVKRFWSDDGEYVVEYVDHAESREGEPPELPTWMQPRTLISADRLILAAGTFGTTYLLLKNREYLPGLSEQLGTSFCGNGDLLGFLRKCSESRNGKLEPRILDGGHGPVITSALHVRDEAEGGSGRGYYVEDAGYPEFFNWLYEGSNQLAVLKRLGRLGHRLVRGWLRLERDSDVSAEIAEALGDCRGSASSLPLLAMGRDIPDGHMRLTKDGMLDIDWRIHASSSYFQRVRATMKDIADALGGKLQPNPLGYLSRVITVHPLGGCPMGRSASEGVVDSYGEVYNHPGLYVADGAVMPGPIGPNPSLTIAALADRFAEHIIEERGRLRPVRREPEEATWQPAPM
jgi:cholesterol oxidase